MKVFVCEFVTGGGLYREPLPSSLAGEGDLMLKSLLADLLEIPEIVVSTSRDARLPALDMLVEVVSVSAVMDLWQCWTSCIREADAVWVIAPETGGVLEKLSTLVIEEDKLLLGSRPAAVAVAASKMSSSAVLSGHGIAVVPTFRPAGVASGHKGAWVAKPDDGAGCEDTRCFDDLAALNAWLEAGSRGHTHVIQPFLPGEAASLSMLCNHGEAWLLSCNRQCISLQDGTFSYGGSILNDFVRHWQGFEEIAQAVAKAVRGLAGYVGIDVMVDGDAVTVLEINPRLTTSYAGLRRAIGCNPARLVLDLLYNGRFELPRPLARNVVEISL